MISESKNKTIFKPFKELSEIKQEITEFLEINGEFQISSLNFNPLKLENIYQIKIGDEIKEFKIIINSLTLIDKNPKNFKTIYFF